MDSDWFDCQYFDEDLVDAIKISKEHKLKADGMCGPATYRRALADKFKKSLKKVRVWQDENYIVCNRKNSYRLA